MKKQAYVLVILAVVNLLIYLPTLKYGFIWDDFNYILNNLNLNDSFSKIWSLSNSSTSDYWPMSFSLLKIIKLYIGSEPWGFKLVNIILHSTSVLLIYQILVKLKIKFPEFISLVYLIHPMNVSLVVWAFQIKTNLAILFFLISLSFYINFVDESKENRKLRWTFYLVSLICFVLSLLSKIMFVLFPIFYLIYYFYRKKEAINAFLISIPFFVVSLLYGLVNFFWYKSNIPLLSYEKLTEQSFLYKLETSMLNLNFYLSKALVPIDLMFIHPKHSYSFNDVCFQLLMPSIFIFLMFFYLYKKNWKFFLIYLFVLLIFAPVSGFFEIYFFRYANVAEHYFSLGIVALSVILAYFADKVISNKFVLKIIFIFILGVFYFDTINYSKNYENELKLLLHNVSKNPNSSLVWDLLGKNYKQRNENYKAKDAFEMSIKIEPTPESLYSLSDLYFKLGEIDHAIDLLKQSSALNPFFAETDNKLGFLYQKKNDRNNAIKYFELAISKSPQNAIFYYNLSITYEKFGEIDNAIYYLEKGISLNSSNEVFHKKMENLIEMKQKK